VERLVRERQQDTEGEDPISCSAKARLEGIPGYAVATDGSAAYNPCKLLVMAKRWK